MTRYGPYVASYQTGAESGPSVDVIANSDMPFVGQLFEGDPWPGPLWTGPNAKRCFARYWIENATYKGDALERQYMLKGATGADEYVALLRRRYELGASYGILDVKGPNEPHPAASEMSAYRDFWLRWIELLKGMGLRPWALCWSSGTPPIEEVGYWVSVVRAARAAGGGLCAHHYNAPHLLNDPYGEWPQYADPWYSRRFEKIIDALYAAGLERGTGWYWIGEFGIDGNGIDWAGDPAFQGKRKRLGWRDWGDWGITWPSYQQELVSCAGCIWARPEILGVELYIAHQREQWKSFCYDVEQLTWMASGWAGYAPGTGEVIMTPTTEEIRNAAWNALGVAYNPTAAFQAYARQHGLGAPLRNEHDLGSVRLQEFMGGIVYAPIGAWSEVTHIAW